MDEMKKTKSNTRYDCN